MSGGSCLILNSRAGQSALSPDDACIRQSQLNMRRAHHMNQIVKVPIGVINSPPPNPQHIPSVKFWWLGFY